MSTAVKITASVDDEELVLQVWNAGEPIPAESLGKIFEPSWRHSASAGRNGLGLALHICSQIVQPHHGRILRYLEPGAWYAIHSPFAVRSAERAAARRSELTFSQ